MHPDSEGLSEYTFDNISTRLLAALAM